MNKNKKYLMIFLLAWIFLYFFSSVFNSGREFFDLSLRLDSSIPIIPIFSLFYLLYFPLVLLPFILFYNDVKLLKKITYSQIIVIVASNIIFLIFPVSIIMPEVAGTSLFTSLLNLIYFLDNPVNLFPSLHVSMATLSFLILFKFKRNLSLYLLIFYVLSIISTLFIKQHYVLDIIAGLILAAIVYFIYFKKEK